ncbi:glycosyltransferase family 39 protein [Candidatus Curtissbacteria bacterium]|nr:glycosyltransferase family 39 protein [Candidatus Curtissbacteria bacterium]
MFKKHIVTICLLVGVFLWALIISETHPSGTWVSWDQGFHAGGALYLSKTLQSGLDFGRYKYIFDDFAIGIYMYPHLWLLVAGICGAILGPSLGVFRLATMLFAIASILLIAAFTKRYGGTKALIIAVMTLAFNPTFIVYSHLTMLEVPFLFSVSLALLMYWRYLTKKKLGLLDIVLTGFAFFAGTQSKMHAITMIVGTVCLFGVLLLIFSRKTQIFKRFFSFYTLLFLGLSFASLLIYEYFTLFVFHFDPIGFNMEITKRAYAQSNLVDAFVATLSSLFNNPYLNEFFRTPYLSLFWFISLFGYALYKRTYLSFFLIAWVVAVYIVLSAARPQDPKELMPLYAPISIAAGLFWSSVFKSRVNFLLLLTNIIVIGWFTMINAHLYWIRIEKTNQEAAANYIAKNANYGDSVISAGDGTTFLVRQVGMEKNLRTINAARPECLNSQADWAILGYDQQNQTMIETIREPLWIKKASYRGDMENTVVFRNTESEKVVDPMAAKCLRYDITR